MSFNCLQSSWASKTFSKDTTSSNAKSLRDRSCKFIFKKGSKIFIVNLRFDFKPSLAQTETRWCNCAVQDNQFGFWTTSKSLLNIGTSERSELLALNWNHWLPQLMKKRPPRRKALQLTLQFLPTITTAVFMLHPKTWMMSCKNVKFFLTFSESPSINIVSTSSTESYPAH